MTPLPDAGQADAAARLCEEGRVRECFECPAPSRGQETCTRGVWSGCQCEPAGGGDGGISAAADARATAWDASALAPDASALAPDAGDCRTDPACVTIQAVQAQDPPPGWAGAAGACGQPGEAGYTYTGPWPVDVVLDRPAVADALVHIQVMPMGRDNYVTIPAGQLQARGEIYLEELQSSHGAST